MKNLRNPEMFDAFSKWLALEPGIQPIDGINITDIDKFVHKFCFWENGHKSRTVQCMLGLEIKTNGADVQPNQEDTLYKVHQLITTAIPGFQEPENGKIRAGHFENCRRVFSWFANLRSEIELKCYGIFLLRFSGFSPDDSEWMEWGCFYRGKLSNRRRISKDFLKQILQFERHPVSFAKGNPARCHKKTVDRRPCLPFRG